MTVYKDLERILKREPNGSVAGIIYENINIFGILKFYILIFFFLYKKK